MLYLLQSLFINNWGVLRIFKSITIRASIAFIIAFIFMLIFGKPFIKWLKKKKYGDTAREEGPQSHFSKSGTPTMGGLLIIGAIIFSTLIAGNFTNKFIIFLFIITILFTTIGFYDDYLKLTRNKNGLSGKKKIAGQLIITALTFFFVYKFGLINKEIDFSIVNPVFKNSYFYITPVLFFVFMALVIIGSSNAVNLTDGLDGLATSTNIIAYATYGIIATHAGQNSIAVFCFCVVGGLAGFLLFNWKPAKVFMGDVGSLALGAGLAIISIMLHKEWTLLLVGIIFVFETLSVILQVGSFKLTGKRIFKMSPIHHHFEMSGWKEVKIVSVFSAVGLVAGLIVAIIL